MGDASGDCAAVTFTLGSESATPGEGAWAGCLPCGALLSEVPLHKHLCLLFPLCICGKQRVHPMFPILTRHHRAHSSSLPILISSSLF